MTDGLLFAAIAACGTAVQRGAGIGFALIAVPVFSLLVGPVNGVLLANVLSVPVNGLVLLATWPGVAPRILLRLVPAGIIGVAPGAWMVLVTPEHMLYVFTGSIVSLGVLMVYTRPPRPLFDHHGGDLAAAATSGFLNATSATGGPAMAIYAAGTGWPPRSFVPNLQALNIFISAASLSMKGFPAVSLSELILAGCGLAIGALIGSRIVRIISERMMVHLALTIAMASGLATTIKGVMMW